MFAIKEGNNPPAMFNDEASALAFAKGRWPAASAVAASSASGAVIAFVDAGSVAAFMEGPVTPATLSRWRSA